MNLLTFKQPNPTNRQRTISDVLRVQSADTVDQSDLSNHATARTMNAKVY